MRTRGNRQLVAKYTIWSNGGGRALLCGIWLAAAAAADSGPAPPMPPVDPAPVPPPLSVGPVVVTATRIETPIKLVGSSVTVISGEELERKQYRFVLDALREVPGVEVRRSGGYGSQTSIFTRGTDSDQTLVLIDGVSIEDPSTPNGLAAIENVLVAEIDRIEVVRGPQSTLYGSDAIGGVINIITKRGDGEIDFQLAGEGGSHGTTMGRFRSSAGGERWDYFVNLTRFDSNSISSRTDNSERDSYSNTTFAGRFGVAPNDVARADLTLRYIDADVDFDAGTNIKASETDFNELLAKLEPQLSLVEGRWDQRLSLWVHNVERDNDGSGFTLPSKFEGTTWGAEWRHILQLSQGQTLIVGSEYEYQEIDDRVVGFPRVDPDTHNLAFYGEYSLQFWKRAATTLGVRYDDHADFGSKVTYRATGVYGIVETGTTFRGSVGTGFKAPSLNELYDSSFGSDNADLDEETSFGFDAGFEQALFDDRLRFGATYFYNDVDDNIVAIFDPVTMNFVNTNVEKIETQGVESFIAVQPWDFASARFHYTYTSTEAKQAASFGVSDGSQLLRRPRNTFGADLYVRFLDDRAQVTTTILYVGERKDLDPMLFTTVTAPSYWLVNLAGSMQLNEHLNLYARVDNVFDEHYSEVLGFEAPGVGAFGGVEVTF